MTHIRSRYALLIYARICLLPVSLAIWNKVVIPTVVLRLREHGRHDVEAPWIRLQCQNRCLAVPPDLGFPVLRDVGHTLHELVDDFSGVELIAALVTQREQSFG